MPLVNSDAAQAEFGQSAHDGHQLVAPAQRRLATRHLYVGARPAVPEDHVGAAEDFLQREVENRFGGFTQVAQRAIQVATLRDFE